MHDIVGRFWAIAFGVLFVYLGAIAVFANRKDTINQNFISAETERYVDTKRAKQEFNEEDYKKFIAKLDSTGETYDVTIAYYRKKSGKKALASKTGSENTADIQEYYQMIGKEELLEDVRAVKNGQAIAGKVYLSEGDFIKVTVTNRTATKGEQFMSLITGTAKGNGGKLSASFGGYVGSD